MEREDNLGLEMSLLCSVSAKAFALSTIDSPFLLSFFFSEHGQILFSFSQKLKGKSYLKRIIALKIFSSKKEKKNSKSS